MKKILFLTVTSIFPLLLFSQTYVPGNIYYDSTGYVEYRAGNLPIIISAPHGGSLEPSSIPDRTCTGCILEKDGWTRPISEGMYDEIFEQTGCYPHVIINLLHRKKFDANRDIGDAADGNPSVEQAWYAYHDFIDSAKVKIVSDYGRGIFFDIHGHGHVVQKIELGYLLDSHELQYTDSILNNDSLIEESSIRSLVFDNINNYSHALLLRGPFSFGTLLNTKGFTTAPSFSEPSPLEPFFDGGYNTQRHGSRDNQGAIDAIQIELNQDIRFDDSTRLVLIDSLAQSALEYYDLHYNNKFLNNYCNLITLRATEHEKFDMKLYPNPSADYFYLFSEIDGSELTIFNSLGQKVLSEQLIDKLNKVKIENLSPGLYFVKIIKNNKTLNIIKLIKE